MGDLDRVIQLGAPNTVASVLQRLGRTGRRAESTRNLTFLATDDAELLRAAGLLLLMHEGFVEPVAAPPKPLHVGRTTLGDRLTEAADLPQRGVNMDRGSRVG